MMRRSSKIGTIANQFSNSVTAENNSIESNETSSASLLDQNLFCIWYHDDDLSENIQNEMNKRLKELFTYIRIFNDPCEFAAYLISPLVQKIFFILTSKLAEYLYVVATKRPQCKKAYQLQPTVSLANIKQLCKQISEDVRAYLDKNQSPSSTELPSTSCRRFVVPPPWSIWNSKKKENSFRYWKKESPEFFLFQTLSRILIHMKCDHDQSLAEMLAECRNFYINDKTEVSKVDTVAQSYRDNNPIWFYTNDSFLFRLLGRAFRSEDFEYIFKFRRYIFDLHQELSKLIDEQKTLQKIPTLYRGKKLSTTVLQQLTDNIGALISMNGFLSTTYSRETALNVFAGAEETRLDYESVLFEFCIDEATFKMTYADISMVSQYPEEQEVLFTIGSIWKIDSVKEFDDLYWIVKLSSSNDISLRIIQFYEKLTDDSTLLMLGDVLHELGQDEKAEKFYNKMLKDPTIEHETRLTLYYNIAMINMEQERDYVALQNLEEAEKLIPSTMINAQILAFQSLYAYNDTPSSIRILNNMGFLYQKNGDSEKALEYFNKALDDKKGDQIDKATVYDNIGLLYYGEGDYENGVKHLKEAVKLAQNDPSITKFKQHYDAIHQHLILRSNSLDQELNKGNKIFDQ